MSDPLSSIASVVTIADCAAGSTKLLLEFFRRFRGAPQEIRQWLEVLESLSIILSRLQQQSAGLEPAFSFSPHFRRRLLDCLTYLRTCIDDVSKYDRRLHQTGSDAKPAWDSQAKRSWRRVKWVAVEGHKIRKSVDVIKSYHFEFSMELLMQLLKTCGPPSASSNQPLRRHTESNLQPVGHSRERMEFPSRTIQGLALEPSPQPSRNNRVLQKVAVTSGHTPGFRHYEKAGSIQTLAIGSLGPQQFIRTSFMISWRLWACNLTLRAGPVIALRTHRDQEFYLAKLLERIGWGLMFSFDFSKTYGSRADLVLQFFRTMAVNQTKAALHWDLDFPRIVPVDAEAFAFARKGTVASIRELLRTGSASAKDVNPFGTTLLHSASKAGNLELVRLLVRGGADVNAQDEDGETPLHRAMATNDNLDIARHLLENGADLSNQAIDGKTPLHNIFNSTIGQVMTMEYLIEDALPDSEGMSISHFLAWSSKSTSTNFHNGRKHDMASLWSVDVFGRNCLHLAASRGNLDVLSYLLKRASPSEINWRDCQGSTPLHYAVQSSRATKAMRLLSTNGCKVGAVNGLGQTALHQAAQWQNLAAAKELVALSPENTLSCRDQNGMFPSQLACQGSAPDLHRFLKEINGPTQLTRTSVSSRETHLSQVNEGHTVPHTGKEPFSLLANNMLTILVLTVLVFLLGLIEV